MAEGAAFDVNRRGFLQGGAAVAASALAAHGNGEAQAQAAAPKPTIARRKLGNTGAEVTILELGTWRNSGLQRLLLQAYDNGVRTFDTADCYGSEPAFARWFAAKPEV